MTIHVTEQHIARGDKGICRSCPIALALKDAGLIDPSVWQKSCGDIGTGKVYRLPKEATDFIYAFDTGIPVKPISFEIREVVQVPWETR